MVGTWWVHGGPVPDAAVHRPVYECLALGAVLPKIWAMSAPSVLRAPALHRATAALACPVVGYFVARLLLRFTGLPRSVTYAVCLVVGLSIGYRAWVSRVELRPDSLRVHNSLGTSTLTREKVHRVSDRGRVETRDSASRRPAHLPADALHDPWWAFGRGRVTYCVNREQVRSWTRVEATQARSDSAT